MFKIARPRLVIVGPDIPPVGGVSIHVSRLRKSLIKDEIEYSFIKNSLYGVLRGLVITAFGGVLHLHSSNVFVRLFVACVGRLLGSKVVITYHGNLGRYGYFKNIIDNISLFFVFVPVVINLDSYRKSVLLNDRTKNISSFIPPVDDVAIAADLRYRIHQMRVSHRRLFATNAYKYCFDYHGREVYGILGLIDLFIEYPDYALVVCDPSGTYSQYLIESGAYIPENVLFVDYPISFYSLLSNVDAVIRNTVTDGDSLSVKEALFLGKDVYCTNVVSRPEGVVLYVDIEDLKRKMSSHNYKKSIQVTSGYSEIKALYECLLS